MVRVTLMTVRDFYEFSYDSEVVCIDRKLLRTIIVSNNYRMIYYFGSMFISDES